MARTPAHPSGDEPGIQIRRRITEKRVFEARFLLRQLSDDLNIEEKAELAETLGRLQSEAEQLLQEARALAAAGGRERAADLYRRIEELVIDMPGVAEERAALAGAEALAARFAAGPVQEEEPEDWKEAGLDIEPQAVDFSEPEPVPEPEPESGPVPAEAAAEVMIPASGQAAPASPQAGDRPRRHRLHPFGLVLILGLAVLALLLVWAYKGLEEKPSPLLQSVAPKKGPAGQEQQIRISPLITPDPPAPPPAPRQVETPPAPETAAGKQVQAPAPAADPAAPGSTPSLHMGVLEVKDSAR